MLIEQKTINATQHNHSNFNTVPLIIGPIIRGFDRLFLKACDDACVGRKKVIKDRIITSLQK